jgi:hypothetical protein
MIKKMIIVITIVCIIQNSFTMQAKKYTNSVFLNLLQKNPQTLIFSRRIDQTGKVRDLEYIRNAKELHKEWKISDMNKDEISRYLYVVEEDLRSNDYIMCTFTSGKQAIIANLRSGKLYPDGMHIFEANTNAPLATSQTNEFICKEAEELYNYHQSFWFKPWMPLSTNDMKENIIKWFWQK